MHATHEAAMATTAKKSAELLRAAVQVRLQGSLYERLENWRRSRPKIPARSEALRQLLERALAEHQPGAAA
jgi:metal-responsive CopG/Arc/MetJ family transcriptional regulator